MPVRCLGRIGRSCFLVRPARSSFVTGARPRSSCAALKTVPALFHRRRYNSHQFLSPFARGEHGYRSLSLRARLEPRPGEVQHVRPHRFESPTWNELASSRRPPANSERYRPTAPADQEWLPIRQEYVGQMILPASMEMVIDGSKDSGRSRPEQSCSRRMNCWCERGLDGRFLQWILNT